MERQTKQQQQMNFLPQHNITLVGTDPLANAGVIAGIVIGATALLMILIYVSYRLIMHEIIKARKRTSESEAHAPFAKGAKLVRNGIFVLDANTGKTLFTLPPASFQPDIEAPVNKSGRSSFVKFKDRLEHDNPNGTWEAFDCKTPHGKRIRAWVNSQTNEVKVQRFDSHKRKVKKSTYTTNGGFIIDRKGRKILKMEKKPLQRTASFINFSATLDGPESAYEVFQDDLGKRFWVHKETQQVVTEDPNQEIPGFAQEFRDLLSHKLSPEKKKKRQHKSKNVQPKLQKKGSFIIDEQGQKVVRVPPPTSPDIVTVRSPPMARTGSFKSFLASLDAPENWEAFEDKTNGMRYWVNVRNMEVRYQDPTQREAGRMALTNE